MWFLCQKRKIIIYRLSSSTCTAIQFWNYWKYTYNSFFFLQLQNQTKQNLHIGQDKTCAIVNWLQFHRVFGFFFLFIFFNKSIKLCPCCFDKLHLHTYNQFFFVDFIKTRRIWYIHFHGQKETIRFVYILKHLFHL